MRTKQSPKSAIIIKDFWDPNRGSGSSVQRFLNKGRKKKVAEFNSLANVNHFREKQYLLIKQIYFNLWSAPYKVATKKQALNAWKFTAQIMPL